jgi:hypothetical protein
MMLHLPFSTQDAQLPVNVNGANFYHAVIDRLRPDAFVLSLSLSHIVHIANWAPSSTAAAAAWATCFCFAQRTRIANWPLHHTQMLSRRKSGILITTNIAAVAQIEKKR